MATTSLGRLTLDLAVRLQEFTDGMSRAERETQERTQNMQASITSFREHLANELGGTQIGGIIDSLNERFGSLEGGFARIGAGVAGMAAGGIVVGLGALSNMAIEAAKADAQMAMLANRANITTEHFQVLTGAAQGLGYEQEQLADIFADVQEKLGEFSATQGGGAADFFDALRNNTKMTDAQIKEFGKTLQGKDGVEAVQLIKDKMDELGATSQEQRFVFESLASDLTNLMPLFADGGKLLGEYGEALQEAGVIKTQKAIEQSQLLAAQTQSLHQRFDGFKSQLAGQMIPILGSLGQYFFSGGQKGSALGGIIQGVGVVAKGVASVILVFGGAIALFGDTVGQVIAQLGNVATTAVNVLMADGVEAKMQALSQGFRSFQVMGSDYINNTINRFKDLDSAIGGVVNGQTVATDKLTAANLALSQSQQKVTDGLKVDTKTANDNAKAKEAQILPSEKAAWERVITNAKKYNFAGIEKQYGLPPGLLSAIHMQESKGNPNAVSFSSNGKWGHAKGGFQFIDDTWRRFGKGNVFDMNDAAPAAGKFLSFLYKEFNGDVQKVIAAYNTGEGNVKKYGMARIMTNGYATMKNGVGQTFDYVKKVSRYRAAYNGGTVQDISTKDFLESQAQAEEKRQKDEESQLQKALDLRKLYGTKQEQLKANLTEKIKKIRENTKLTDAEKTKFIEQATKDSQREMAVYSQALLSTAQSAMDFAKTDLQKLQDARKEALDKVKNDPELTRPENAPYLETTIKAINAKYDYEEQKLKQQIEQQRSELLNYTKDERQILADNWNAKIADAKLAYDDLAEERVKSLEAQRDKELELFDITQSEELLNLKKSHLTAIDYINQKYDLIARRAAQTNMTPERRAAQAQADWESYNKETVDSVYSVSDNYKGVISDLYGQRGLYDASKSNADERTARIDAVQQAMDAGLIQAQEYNNALFEIDQSYLNKKRELWASQYTGIFGTLTSTMGMFFGQQSKMYRVASAMQKGYAVYQAMLAARTTYISTFDSVSKIPMIGPYIAAPMAAAATAIQVAQAAQINSIQPPSFGGVAHGGLDYVPKETTFLLDKGERVLSPRQNKDLTRYLNERQANTGGSVNVYNNSSAQVTAERQPDGTVTIDVVDKMIKRSWGKVAQANSFESRQIQKHTTARFNRQ